MERENPIRTLRYYYKPSHEGYKNTIELPKGNNVGDEVREEENVKPNATEYNDHEMTAKAEEKVEKESEDEFKEEIEEQEEEEEDIEYFDTFPSLSSNIII
nr:hypothetical protein [Tanacetum cinerariifolium]